MLLLGEFDVNTKYNKVMVQLRREEENAWNREISQL